MIDDIFETLKFQTYKTYLKFLQNPDRSQEVEEGTSQSHEGCEVGWPVVTGGDVSLSVWRGDEAPL